MGSDILPSRIVHYCIACELQKKFKIDSHMFILGNFAADAHDGTKEGNYASHFKFTNEQESGECLDLALFREKYMKNNPDYFIIGYYCHLISDNEWFKQEYSKHKIITEDDKHRISGLYYKDYEVLNLKLIDRYKLREIETIIPDTVGVEEISASGIKRILNYLEGDFLLKPTQSKLVLLTLEGMIEFIDSAVNECVRGVNELGIYSES
jgi:hypothetical protein